jgi:hypothetical protein
MSLEGNYTFAGIGAAEAKTRYNEHRTGVPPQGSRQALLSAPVRYTTDLKVMNQGSEAADVRLAHGLSEKAITGEHLAAFDTGALTTFRGRLQFGSIKPGTLSITNAGAPATVVDDGAGLLVDTGTTTKRGTVDYASGTIDLTFGAAATAPVVAAYTHTDYVEFTFAQSQTATAAGTYPEAFPTQFGRVVPGTVTLTDGTRTFVDDGKGNMIETGAGGPADVVGTVDYALGIITLTTGSATLTAAADSVVIGYSFNPFGSLLVPGGSVQGMSLLSPDIPELGSESFADGIKGESRLALVGETRTNRSTNLVTQWGHHCEEPYRVTEEYTSFPPGGATNDPRIDQGF